MKVYLDAKNWFKEEDEDEDEDVHMIYEFIYFY